MIQRLYVHNFRCFENFELPLAGRASTLLIGQNGRGKSTVSHALAVLQGIARGTNRVGQLVKPRDFFLNHHDAPMRFELDASLGGHKYQYRLALEYPSGFRELRVRSEQFLVDDTALYSRELAQVTLARRSSEQAPSFRVDWHTIALPIIQEQSEADPLSIFKRWVANWILLAPIPSQIVGESKQETLAPERDLSNLGDWFAGILAYSPRSYSVIERYLKEVMPDFYDVKNPLGGDTRSLFVQFRREGEPPPPLRLPFAALSDGEKCHFIGALVLAANEAYGPLFCFWDEPSSHLSISEVGHFIATLRQHFASSGQAVISSHSQEVIRGFSNENTLMLYRRSHLEPTRVDSLDNLGVTGDLIETLLRGDLEYPLFEPRS